MSKFCADAFFITEKGQKGEDRHLVRRNGNWEWRNSSQIANLDKFNVNSNPLLSLLCGGVSSQFRSNELDDEDSEMFKFEVKNKKEKVFAVNTVEQNFVPLELPSKPIIIDDKDNKYTLDDLYKMAEDVAVDE